MQSESHVSCLICLAPLGGSAGDSSPAARAELGCGHSDFCARCVLRLVHFHRSSKDRRKAECPLCKKAIQTVSITREEWQEDGDTLLARGNQRRGHRDPYQSAVRYQHREDLELYSRLQRLFCPVPDCKDKKRKFNSIGSLKQHVQREHRPKLLCGVCCDGGAMLFWDEFKLFPSQQDLTKHTKEGDADTQPHARCRVGDCRRLFYDGDALFEHQRDAHFQCHVCATVSGASVPAFASADALRVHFAKKHYLCEEAACIANTFIVFDSQARLLMHQLDEHRDKYSADEISRKEHQLVFAANSEHSRAREAPVSVVEEAAPVEFPTLGNASTNAVAAGGWQPRATAFPALGSSDSEPVQQRARPRRQSPSLQPASASSVSSQSQSQSQQSVPRVRLNLSNADLAAIREQKKRKEKFLQAQKRKGLPLPKAPEITRDEPPPPIPKTKPLPMLPPVPVDRRAHENRNLRATLRDTLGSAKEVELKSITGAIMKGGSADTFVSQWDALFEEVAIAPIGKDTLLMRLLALLPEEKQHVSAEIYQAYFRQRSNIKTVPQKQRKAKPTKPAAPQTVKQSQQAKQPKQGYSSSSHTSSVSQSADNNTLDMLPLGRSSSTPEECSAAFRVVSKLSVHATKELLSTARLSRELRHRLGIALTLLESCVKVLRQRHLLKDGQSHAFELAKNVRAWRHSRTATVRAASRDTNFELIFDRASLARLPKISPASAVALSNLPIFPEHQVAKMSDDFANAASSDELLVLSEFYNSSLGRAIQHQMTPEAVEAEQSLENKQPEQDEETLFFAKKIGKKGRRRR
ncbi:MAG: hypothetical protein MHM6MM_002633 [Cercozoa sp. M6MM]